MLYLDEVAIHNFKSFKNATIKLTKGFNCIVGPNGSGKSNICDALLFVLGEMSPKRMRISSSIQLINNTLKQKDDSGFKRASVKVKFSGDKDIEIIRAIRSDRKIAYRLDGKRVTRQEVLDMLGGFGGNVNETNTMTQGEIATLITQSAKERREMIDVAAGIKEFNNKKDDALKELEKVETKIRESRILMGERSSFLEELEKDKASAERHLELTTSIKQMQYTVLKLREKEVGASFEEAAKQLLARTELMQRLEKQINDFNLEINAQTAERDRISKSLTAKSAENASTNGQMQEVMKNIAVNTSETASAADRIKSAKSRIEHLSSEVGKNKAAMEKNEEAIKKYAFEAEVKGKDLPDTIESAGDKEIATLNDKFDSNYKKSNELSLKLVSASSDLSRLTSEYGGMSRDILEIHKSMNEWGAKRTKYTNNIKSCKEALTNFQKSRDEVAKDLVVVEAKLRDLNEKRNSLDTENITLREQLAHAGRDSGASDNAIKKELGASFHGRVQDICTYDDKYALAVQSAAGGRFGYFVVDNISDANKAIGVLKSKKLGRASFIPIEEVSARNGKAPPGAKSMIDCITFEKKYQKVFSYVFANTYLVNNIKEAQKLGVGSFRYVTIEGDIVEPSGIVSGGSMRVSLSGSLLSSKLKKVEAERSATIEKIAETAATLDLIKKKIGNYEAEITNYDIELKHSLSGEDEANRNMDTLNDKIRSYEEKAKEHKSRIDALNFEKEREEQAIKLFKEENDAIRDKVNSMISNKTKGSRSKEDAEKLKALREEVGNLKTKAATTTKENEMLVGIVDNLEKELKEAKTTLSNLEEKQTRLEKELVGLNKQKEELLTEMEGHDKKSKGMFKDLRELDEKLEKLGKERGKLQTEKDKADRETIELEGRKSQLQTRLGDLKAEFTTHQKMEVIEGASAEELDKKLIIARTDLDRLGNVNLKAPEMYEARKKDVDEARQKMETLESEKASIMLMIEQIDAKKLGVFTETLEAVDKNFQQLFTNVFDGSAKLYLSNQKDPFNSGLLVDVHLGTKKHNLDQMSGGQKSLIVLMLLFAIQMRTPMSFYLFDEIDAALDKENSKKLSMLIKQMSSRSQFIVVSHNDSLIQAADTAIGVVHNTAESQVVGVQLVGKQ